MGLVQNSFAVRSVELRLESVSDVAGAVGDRSLSGSEDAFVLEFSGSIAEALESGIHTLSHPALGTFELFISPVKRPGTDRIYEAVIDRSV